MYTFGIDIGTTFLTIHSLERGGTILRERHGGRMFDRIMSFVGSCEEGSHFSFTGKGADEFCAVVGREGVEESVAVLKGLERSGLATEGFLRVIDIGGSSLTLYSFKGGKVSDIVRNALCAAGTGLFLEEQAERLGIDIEGRGEMGVDDPPLVASRCTVFAKSDLIHHQQEGRSREELWAGLCKSLAISAMNTLFRGEDVYGRIVLIGGVALNREVVKWLKVLYPRVEWVIPREPAGFIAMGAAEVVGIEKGVLEGVKGVVGRYAKRMPPLTLKRSRYPTLVAASHDEEGSEVRVHRDLTGIREVALGVDIGSTSTKVVVLDAATRQPLFDLYRKTAGDPIGAARRLFAGCYRILGDREVEVVAVGTTGSGRKLVGEVFGADTIVNEITAHGTGAVFFDPTVETIFEIGGQDSKYMRMEDGFVADVNMNYVCAAGTGSFVEEQARKLGYTLDQIGKVTEHLSPPVTSDRCTVFMEQDLRAILKQGYRKEEALAAVLYSVIQNYLTKVVGNRAVSRKRVHFQGATARNKGLVAAIENLLGVEVVVSPFCHVMGAIGAALIALEETAARGKSRFIGRAAATVDVKTGVEICRVCINYCRINTIVRGDGSQFSWGYMCGREPGEERRRDLPTYAAFRKRNALFYEKGTESKPARGIIHIPHTLVNYTYYPLWRRFFALLGYETRLSAPYTTVDVRTESARLATGDFCYPAKVSIGHAVTLFDRGAMVFHPHYISDRQQMETAFSFFCPYVESNPSVIRSFAERSGRSDLRFLTPVIDLRLPIERIAKTLTDALASELPVKRREVEEAFRAAYHGWEEIYARIRKEGEAIVSDLLSRGEPVFVIVGRPYNIHDRGINLGIPEAIAAMGYHVVPIDMLELDVASLAKTNYYNLFWNYGQRIVAAAKRIRSTDNLFLIYLTNFNCGPDSFLLSYVEEEMKGKPMLILELDEHDSDGGYRTRVEAFMDVIKGFRRRGTSLRLTGKPTMPDIFTPQRRIDLHSGVVWIPPIQEATARLVAAAFRAAGYESAVLDTEDKDALLLGRKHSRGCECLPLALTLGSIMKKAQREPHRNHIVCIPTTEGPCRFGQYNLLERMAFWRAGISNVEIFAPSSANSYHGTDERLWRYAAHAFFTGDILMKLTTKIRPYEFTAGDTNEVFEKSLTLLEKEIESKGDPRRVLSTVVGNFARISRRTERRPLVGIVGEIYMRSDRFCNNNLVAVIEQNGGEAWISPIHEWGGYMIFIQDYMTRQQGFSIYGRGISLLLNLYYHYLEKSFYRVVTSLLSDRREPTMEEMMKEATRYLPIDFTGDAILAVGRTIIFARQGAKMVINIAPFGCMPGTITSAILLELKDLLGIPIVNQFYDGGTLDINDKVRSILKTIV